MERKQLSKHPPEEEWTASPSPNQHRWYESPEGFPSMRWMWSPRIASIRDGCDATTSNVKSSIASKEEDYRLRSYQANSLMWIWIKPL